CFFRLAAPCWSRYELIIRPANSLKVWVKTPWARSRWMMRWSCRARASAARPRSPTPAWRASPATAAFHASKSPPQSCARASIVPARARSRQAVAAGRCLMRRLPDASGELSARCWAQPIAPLCGATIKDIDVGVAFNTRHDAGPGILPEQEGAPVAADVGERGHGAQPPVGAVKVVDAVVHVEIDGRVDDRPLAIVAREHVQETTHFGLHRCGIGAQPAGWRTVIPLHVEHRGQC